VGIGARGNSGVQRSRSFFFVTASSPRRPHRPRFKQGDLTSQSGRSFMLHSTRVWPLTFWSGSPSRAANWRHEAAAFPCRSTGPCSLHNLGYSAGAYGAKIGATRGSRLFAIWFLCHMRVRHGAWWRCP
jgi:hypothetical protein